MAAQECRYSLAEHGKLRGAYGEQVRLLAAAHPKLLVYDPTGFFCQNGLCADKQGEHLLYNDSNHISTYASEMLLRRMRDEGALDWRSQ